MSKHFSSLDWYMAEALNAPALSPSEERELLDKKARGCKRSRDELIRRNMRFVVHLAKRFASNHELFSDLISAGNEGLVIAVDRYSLRHKNKFSTYARWWIMQRIFFHLNTFTVNSVVTAPRYFNQCRAKLKKTLSSSADEMTSKSAAESLHVNPRLTKRLLNFNATTVQLDCPVLSSGDGDDLLLQDVIQDDNQELSRKVVEREELLTHLKKAIKSELCSRERRIVVRRFGTLKTKGACTLQELADELSLTKERVRQIESIALSKLRRKLAPTMGAENLPWIVREIKKNLQASQAS